MCTPPCQNGGRCVDINKCSCTGGWQGPRCQIGTNSLIKQTCLHIYHNTTRTSYSLTDTIFHYCKCHTCNWNEDKYIHHYALIAFVSKALHTCSIRTGNTLYKVQPLLQIVYDVSVVVSECVPFSGLFYPEPVQCLKACQNGGVCVGVNRCRCPAGFIGTFCENGMCGCV